MASGLTAGPWEAEAELGVLVPWLGGTRRRSRDHNHN